MSILPDHEPACISDGGSAVSLVIEARPRDLGGFSVRRLLPSPQRRLVGPFIFFDHMGPVDFAPGSGMDVRPHPHIALATVTFLFDGEIMHRDSVGSELPIRAGDVNWMIAGRGIAHSERTPAAVRARGGRLHGIQSWVALPASQEEMPPRFDHHPASTIPVVEMSGVRLDVIAGTAYGAVSPAYVLSPTFYVHARCEAGATFPVDDTHEERALYAVEGAFEVDGCTLPAGTMHVLRPRAQVVVRALTAGRLMMVGGAPLDGSRHIWWNFVSSSQERIERAKADWREGRFAKVFHDDHERIPLPDK